PSLTNTEQLSLVVAMTCLNGMFQHPLIESLAEAMMKGGQGGAVAVWASSGLTGPEGQRAAGRDLIEQLFASPGLTIGEATVKAKGRATDQDMRRTWVLFGDPSAKLR
ncbi:MAG TPA: C25 family cysteine peptidase, partial [Blastocatellia bacterium]|nr:C25 family cysteine peptidase [Blastocatellia bacterium]